MVSKSPFSQEDLNDIFKISLTSPDRVISRESSCLEFKESFGWASLPKYLKTSASFANAKGGYIVFGVANRPHKLCGLSGTNLSAFEGLDPEMMTNHLNECFAPEIKWDIHEHELQGKRFGLLYFHEAERKPVVCIKDSGRDLQEGLIYYRYRGRSQRVKYPELREILDARRVAEQRLWMKHLVKIARIGVREAGIFDLHTGEVSGAGGAFVIDESLLSQLAFIKEGEFSEVEGKPTLRLIGNVEPLEGTIPGTTKKQFIKTRGIRTADIVLYALNQYDVPEPKEFIKQICFDSSAFMPVYYYIKQSGMTIDQTIVMLEKVITGFTATKSKLIERLRKCVTQGLPITSAGTPAASKKRHFAELLRSNKVDSALTGDDLKYCLQAIRGLTVNEVRTNSEFVRKQLRTWFNRHYSSPDRVMVDNLRRAICWVDEALNMGGITR